MSTSTAKLFYTIADAAEAADCSTDTIRRQIARGELKAYRLGRSNIIRIKTADFQKLWKPVTSLAEVVGE